MTWTQFAVRSSPGSPTEFLSVYPHLSLVKMCGYKIDEIVMVSIDEDAEGDYMGWINAGSDDICMIQHHRIFNIQFPYGYKAEEEAGKGRAVRVRIQLTAGEAVQPDAD